MAAGGGGRSGAGRAAPAPMHGTEEAAAGGPRVSAASTQTDSMAGERGCTARHGSAGPGGAQPLSGRCGGSARGGGCARLRAPAPGGEGGLAKWLPTLRGSGIAPAAGTKPCCRHKALQPSRIPRERPCAFLAPRAGAVGSLMLPSPACFPPGVLCVPQGTGPQTCRGKITPLGGERGLVGDRGLGAPPKSTPFPPGFVLSSRASL